IYTAYNAELARLNGLDFGDLIVKVLELFQIAPDILEKYQKQFKYIMVDEFQDTNAAQMQLLQKLTGNNFNICCVGDDDQSIYSWRGAQIKNILDFEKNFPKTKVIPLEINYRSTPAILGAANSLIKHNLGRLGKDLKTPDGTPFGEKVYILTLLTDRDEARIIARAIINHGDFSQTAVLIRSGSLSRVLGEEFKSCGIPYRLVGAMKFYDRMEIRDVIAYIRLLVYSFDDLSFLRIIGKPRRGFGDSAIKNLRASGTDFMSALRVANLRGKQRISADKFLKLFNFDWENMAPMDAVLKLLEESEYLKIWQDSKDLDAPERLANIKELIEDVISKCNSLPEFLEHAALMTTEDERADIGNVVNIMTIHAAKGLEFDNVYLPAWEEGVFPNDIAIKEGEIEEERRLAYVAITRARKRCVISHSMSRMLYGKREYKSPSRFINEIDSTFVEKIAQGINPYYQQTEPQKEIIKSSSKKSSFINNKLVGKLVSHSELGSGVVIEESGEILTIAFRNKGIKKVSKQFIKL
ncbi:MAG: ATP-dependent helicase, partial [Alphaproteobacteria bacterium]